MDKNLDYKQKKPSIKPSLSQSVNLTPIKQSSDFHENTMMQPQKLEFVVTPHKQEEQFFISLLGDDRPHQKIRLDYSDENQESEVPYIQEESVQESQESPHFEATVKKTRLHPEYHQNSQVSNSKPSAKKKCNCKKSGCLKKYCECFKAGDICSNDCDCQGCSNKREGVIWRKEKQAVKKNITCNCRRSECSKNYCECHSAGLKCTDRCNCLQCKNMGELISSAKKMFPQHYQSTIKKRKYFDQ